MHEINRRILVNSTMSKFKEQKFFFFWRDLALSNFETLGRPSSSNWRELRGRTALATAGTSPVYGLVMCTSATTLVFQSEVHHFDEIQLTELPAHRSTSLPSVVNVKTVERLNTFKLNAWDRWRYLAAE
jgi:hypothetical protein